MSQLVFAGNLKLGQRVRRDWGHRANVEAHRVYEVQQP